MDELEVSETYPVALTEANDAAVDAMSKRAQLVSALAPYAKNPEAAIDLLARLDKALLACAVMSGRDGEHTRRAWRAGADAFLQELG